jgi:hypothetical protein
VSRPTRESAAARALYARVDSRSTGKLAVGAGAVEVAVHLLNGEIVGATSPDDLRQIIRLLVATGAIEASAAGAYEALVDEGGDVFGALLVLGPTFDKALSERFRQNLSDFLSSVSAPRFFEQKTVFVSNLQMGHDSRSLVDELCVVCDLARAVDVDNLVVRGPAEPGPDSLRQIIAGLVGNEPRTISSLLNEIPAEPVRARVAIGAMLQSRVLTPPGLPRAAETRAPEAAQTGLAANGGSPIPAPPRDDSREDLLGDAYDLAATPVSPLEEDDTISAELTRPLARLGSTPVPASRRTPAASPMREASPVTVSPPAQTRSPTTQGRGGKQGPPMPTRAGRSEAGRSEAGRSEAGKTEIREPTRPLPPAPAFEGVRDLPFEESLEYTRAIPELADFEIRTEEPSPDMVYERRIRPNPGTAPSTINASTFTPSGLSSAFSAGRDDDDDDDDDEDVEDARTEQVDRRVYTSSGSLSDWLNRTDAVVEDDLFSDHDYHTRGGSSDGRFRTDTRHLDKVEVGGMPEEDSTADSAPSRVAHGPHSQEIPLRTVPTRVAPGDKAIRKPPPPPPEDIEPEVIEADEASLDIPAIVKYGAPVLTHGDAIAKVEVANEVLSIVSQAFDEANGPGRGRAALQLLVDGVPGPYASVLHDLRIDDAGELPTDQVMRNLQSRPPTEHRQLLNNGLVDLIERALSSAADELPEEVFDEVLGSVAGYRQRLGL